MWKSDLETFFEHIWAKRGKPFLEFWVKHISLTGKLGTRTFQEEKSDKFPFTFTFTFLRPKYLCFSYYWLTTSVGACMWSLFDPESSNSFNLILLISMFLFLATIIEYHLTNCSSYVNSMLKNSYYYMAIFWYLFMFFLVDWNLYVIWFLECPLSIIHYKGRLNMQGIWWLMVPFFG